MNIEEEIARQNREIENKLAEMTESINAQMKRMMEATNPLKFQRAKKDETEDNEYEEIVKGQIKWDDIEDWNCTFVYEYERKGKTVSQRVDLINTDELFLALNDVPLSEEQEPMDYKKIDIELKDTLLKGCVDCSGSPGICAGAAVMPGFLLFRRLILYFSYAVLQLYHHLAHIPQMMLIRLEGLPHLHNLFV